MIYGKSNFINTLISDFNRRVMNERGEVGEEDDGDSEGSGAADEVQQQLTQLQSQLKTTMGEIEQLKGVKSNLEQKLDEADKELLSDEYLEWKDTRSKSKSSPSSAGDELDLDRASNREIAGFIEKRYKGDLDAAVGAIRKELDLSKQQLGMVTAQFDVALTSMRHDGRDGKPSFAEHQKEILDVAKQNPSWNAEKCYQQFVLESKDRLDREMEEKRKKAEEEEKAVTERSGVPSSILKGKQLSKDEAADLAYKKAFGNRE